ncbi:MAG: hypothetical protein GX236_04865 [Clostridiaceae bacterium]|jgi:hypothetical protein|nr:hypothetical protein [Clostridiaceae bacterium]
MVAIIIAVLVVLILGIYQMYCIFRMYSFWSSISNNLSNYTVKQFIIITKRVWYIPYYEMFRNNLKKCYEKICKLDKIDIELKLELFYILSSLNISGIKKFSE